MRISFFCLLGLMLYSMVACKSSYEKAREVFKNGEYHRAIAYLEKSIAKDRSGKLQGKASYWIAECYRLSNRPQEAIPYYQKAIQANFWVEDLPLHYGYALKTSGQYTQAEQQFQQAVKQIANKEKAARAQLELKNILYLKNHQIKPLFDSVRIENFSALNTLSADYGIALWRDKIYFSSTRRKEKIYQATGDGFADIYEFDFAKSESEIQMLPSPISLPGIHDACPTLSADGKTLIFARSTSGKRRDSLEEVNLFASYLVDGEWTEPEFLPVNHARFWDSSPFLSPDGKTLIFASNRPGGYGGIDLYRATLDANGNWSKPVNMGKHINTPGNELFPYISHNRKLYFASDGHPGYGGLDIFEATRLGDSVAVVNVGAPFNTPYDDFGLVFINPERGFFVSNRKADDAQGDDDIYQFLIVPLDTLEVPIQKVVAYYVGGTTLTDFRGGRKPLDSVNVFLIDHKGDTLEKTFSLNDGTFRFKTQIAIGNTFQILAEKNGYSSATYFYNTSGKQIDTTYLTEAFTEVVLDEPQLVLSKNVFEELLLTGEIVLENIYYDFDDYKIRPDAAAELDKLVAFMQANPSIKVELGSHTDARGSDAYNLRLSTLRAKAAVEYIVSKGISIERIVAKGYGETKLLIPNAQTEEEHQLNRRTTVALIK
ncbi:MAG: OmpA family protein [Cytophagales bacterium]|nr:OmpA family protein [Cytophagales bacterium]MDW8383974.1 OmpA family protein [Flammeovirgaceae bacterium]